jgi:hypothetical protein
MLFTIDASGSMQDICNDGISKMLHIHHTLENMLKLFYDNKNIKMSIHVQSFNTSIETIIENVPEINKSNIEVLIDAIHKIEPTGSTNIESALQKASENINHYHVINPTHEIIHIFLTDGEITEGSEDYNILFELVPKNCSNIFIGYGDSHDIQLLTYLSSSKGNSYRFIDALDKAGLVYGEIINSILYKALEDVTLIPVNCELYNYQTNMWDTSLQIGHLLSEQLKTYHIRTKDTHNCHIEIYGKTIIQTNKLQNVGKYELQGYITSSICENDNIFSDLSIYIFRQFTQELLYKARKISEKLKKRFKDIK